MRRHATPAQTRLSSRLLQAMTVHRSWRLEIAPLQNRGAASSHQLIVSIKIWPVLYSAPIDE